MGMRQPAKLLVHCVRSTMGLRPWVDGSRRLERRREMSWALGWTALRRYLLTGEYLEVGSAGWVRGWGEVWIGRKGVVMVLNEIAVWFALHSMALGRHCLFATQKGQ
jgi:hypothetical protein